VSLLIIMLLECMYITITDYVCCCVCTGCLGEKFGYLQIKAIWSHLLRNFDFELVSDKPFTIDYSSIVVGPTTPCLVRYKRRKKGAV